MGPYAAETPGHQEDLTESRAEREAVQREMFEVRMRVLKLDADLQRHIVLGHEEQGRHVTLGHEGNDRPA